MLLLFMTIVGIRECT